MCLGSLANAGHRWIGSRLFSDRTLWWTSFFESIFRRPLSEAGTLRKDRLICRCQSHSISTHGYIIPSKDPTHFGFDFSTSAEQAELVAVRLKCPAYSNSPPHSRH
ncbi:hypothetical protein QCA50_016951 [Cerrena zonata]|uniref:Uncharacterized protein n=1 Tax=Cerrena zonata TaxID=2478898 RepID=A0AAW0FTI4_9APHY